MDGKRSVDTIKMPVASPEALEQIKRLEAEVERLRGERRHLARVAEWLAYHTTGTPVPDWCNLGWSNGEPIVDSEDVKASEAAEEAGDE